MANSRLTLATKVKRRGTRLSLALASLSILGACEAFKDLALFDPLTGKAEQQTDEASTGGPLKLVERDVETPSAFSVEDTGIWDGRPSLGGIWVAYPGNVQPERVNIRNEENGKNVVGALFKRERQNPGPAIQVSSDAANALDVLPGKPTKISIVALRREAVNTGPKPAAAAKVEPEVEVVKIDESKTAAKSAAKPAAEGSAEAAQTIAEAVAAVQPKPGAIAAAPVKETAAADGTPKRPYVQVGVFAREANANKLARKLTDGGILAQARALDAGTKTLYRVVAGPASSVTELKSNLAKIKAQGFADAYTVTR